MPVMLRKQAAPESRRRFSAKDIQTRKSPLGDKTQFIGPRPTSQRSNKDPQGCPAKQSRNRISGREPQADTVALRSPARILAQSIISR